MFNQVRHETVVFDATSKKHREAFAQYLKDSSWKNVNIRFILEPTYISVVDMIKDKLVAYYMQPTINKLGNTK